MNAQALTLGVLSSAAILHYMDLKNVPEGDGTAVDAHEMFEVLSDW